jgi:hypothetical protein
MARLKELSMMRFDAMWRKANLILFALLGWLTVQGTALGQVPAPKIEDKGGSLYVACYAMVILGVGLGMLVLCRGSNRRDRARPEEYMESAVVQETKQAQKK